MINKFPVKLMALGFVVFLIWWFWPSTSGNQVGQNDAGSVSPGGSSAMASSIEPITNAEAASVSSNSLTGRFSEIEIDDKSREDLRSRFSSANDLIASRRYELAISEFDKLIREYPGTPELYANLGSIYAANGQLEQARKTFKEGIQANSKAGALYEGLQKVHGALAANAYKKALDATSPDIAPKPVRLPTANALEATQDQEQIIARLRAQLDSREQSEVNATQTQKDRLRDLQAELDASNERLARLEADHQQELKKLQDEIAKQSETLLASQTAEREAQARVVRAEEASALQLAESLAKFEAQNQLALAEKDSVIKRQQQEANRLKEQAVKPVTEPVVSSDGKVDHNQQAIERVRSWARVWAAQDVSGYVSHYADGYTPGPSISRAQWLEQRQVRLTNKAFIEVAVSDFSVRDMGGQYSVTFTQRYRSNTVDDTIRKRLIFEKADNDWAQAKIVSERRVQS